MLPETRNTIVKNFVTLIKECDVNVVKNRLMNDSVFTQKELDTIFSTEDARHNKRVFFFELQKKEERAFAMLIQALRQTNQTYIADLLSIKKSGKVFHPMRDYDEEIADSDLPEIPQTPVCTDRTFFPVTVKVIHSEEFYDTLDRHPHVEFYHTRSKKRGRVLIINNYEFTTNENVNNMFRNGATTDNDNLLNLFRQMGGWDIEHHNNLPGEQMKIVIQDFARNKENVHYDMCFVILMSHGDEQHNDTIIYGTDWSSVSTSKVQKLFTNENCKPLRGKPKVFLFQVCRGKDVEHRIIHTETDSIEREAPVLQMASQQKPPVNMRIEEDFLVGYSTLLGAKAHRHPVVGSWYIELLCEKFMNFAHNTPVYELLMLVDQGLRKRVSEWLTVQTCEFINRGFKKLYLHPGIYYEDDTIKTFFS